MLQRYEIPVAKEELDRTDSLNFSWKTLREKAFQMQCHLTEIQPNFKASLDHILCPVSDSYNNLCN